MKAKLNNLKKKFCDGKREVIWEMIELTFEDFWLKTLSGDSETNHILAKFADRIITQHEKLCASELPIKIFLEEQFKKISKNKEAGKEDVTLNPAIMNEEGIIKTYSPSLPEKDDSSDSSPFSFYQKSLSALDQIIYEIYYKKCWKKRKGVRKLLLFLVNISSFGNCILTNELKKMDSPLFTPEISEWYACKLEERFLEKNNNAQSWNEFTKSIELMLHPQLENDIKTKIQTVQIKSINFKKQLLAFGGVACTELEIYYYLLHKYLGKESVIEIWMHLNLIGQDSSLIQKELEQLALWEKTISKNDGRKGEASILKKYVGKSDKKINLLRTKMKNIQQQIDAKFGTPIKWNTY